MKLNFKNGALLLALGLTAIFLQTACVNEAERLAAEQKCQISQNEKYSFGFDGFLNPKKVIFREMANGKIIKEQLINEKEHDMSPTPYGFGADLTLTDAKNKNYYQIIIDDRYLFTLSGIKINAYEVKLAGKYTFICGIREFTVNDKVTSKRTGIYKKDAIILPVTTP
jgi:hypothetical protein